jgi:non-ribosomal peptide synthetase component F
VTDFRQRLASLSSEQRILLEQRLRARGVTATPAPPALAVAREPGGEAPPLSFVQERMWLFEQLRPGTAMYHLPSLVRLRGVISPAVLQQSLDEVVRRHEVLRTRIDTATGAARQRVLPAAAVAVQLVDISGIDVAAREAAAQSLANAEIRRLFALGTGPLLRVVLLRLSAEEHILVLTLHHLIADEVAIQVLVREVDALYSAFVRGAPSPLAPLPIQYGDFARWQQRHKGDDKLASDLAYWRAQLAQLPPPPELPLRPRGETTAPRGAVRMALLDGELSARLRAFGRGRRASDFMVFLSAYVALLARYSGQLDLVIGSSLSNRNRRELEELIGCFLNVVLLRVDAAGDPSFAALVERVRAVVLATQSHGDLPFETLMDAWRPVRNPIEIMFELTTRGQRTIKLGEVIGQPLEFDRGAALTHLTLYVEESERGYTCTWEYDSSLFDDATIARMMRHFARLLDAATRAPDQPLSRLELLDDEERARACPRGPERPEWLAGSVDALLAAQAARTPDAIALASGDEQLSYAQLDRAVAALAARLRARGAGPERRVAVLIERSPAMVVALLAVLRAGAAYVPLDPTHPRERVRAILDAADVALVVCSAATRALIDPRAPIFILDATDLASAALDVTVPLAPESLAYVLFTSGSTGAPKGVAIEHRALLSFLRSMRERPGLTADDVLLAVTTVAFDIAGLELLLPLSVGARVHLVPGEAASDAAAVRRALDEQAPRCCRRRRRCGACSSSSAGKDGRPCASCAAARRCRSTWRARWWPVRRRCSTSTARRRRPSGRRWPSSTPATPPCRPCRSASPSPTRTCAWSTATSSRRRWAWPASCTSAVPAWRAAISGAPI